MQPDRPDLLTRLSRVPLPAGVHMVGMVRDEDAIHFITWSEKDGFTVASIKADYVDKRGASNRPYAQVAHPRRIDALLDMLSRSCRRP